MYTGNGKKYITTTLPYANSVAHIGHAFEFIIGDVIARYFRGRLGDENVLFNIGLDEHGQKIYDAAVEAGKTPKEYLDELALKWKQFCHEFGIQANTFYRTSHPKHYAQVQKFWNHCLDKQLLYKATYRGLYCKGCESKILEKDLVDGKCLNHPTTALIPVEEENYFFKLTKFRKELLDWQEKEIFLLPRSKHAELTNFTEDVEDVCVSRYKENVPWGIPVPNDDSQVIYVWFEALLNYILVLGYEPSEFYGEKQKNFEDYWEESIQVFGPDNLRFQALMFQGILKAAGVAPTRRLLCHGTILDKEGKKMSKSVGNVVDPIDQLNKFGVDAVRYYAIAGLQTYGNSSWSEQSLIELHNSHLAHNYGNLVNRVIHLINKFEVDINPELENNYQFFKIHLDTIGTLYEIYDLTAAMEALNDVISSANLYITEKAPWLPESAGNRDSVLRTLHRVLIEASCYYLPVIPVKANEALRCLKSLEKVILFKKIESVAV